MEELLSPEVIAPSKENLMNLEKELIRSMAGCYKVSFQFAETFAPDKTYQYADRKFEEAIEYVFVLAETERKISLQHILMAGEKMLIKHWRQDWLYENEVLMVYDKDNEWKKIPIPADQAKGTWTQQVFQVNDEPRYQGFGTWVHVDGRHFWESTADAPLPRRDTKRLSDYNVLRRHSHLEIMKDGGWQLEQDNEKILRTADTDRLICWEKGFETFTTGDYDGSRAIKWWEENKAFWATVRQAWQDIFTQYNRIKIHPKIEGKMLYEHLFGLSAKYATAADYNEKEALNAIETVLDQYVIRTS